ncbi:hypothetical protein SAY86_021813 [Trapa natans]|uniref:Uncharacterized protein n=1 Tax=Trapa natans TaxID=22666 RepID=A0AAN7MD72_TRANT|nr:hypothetical protein SAY86_021813 [Trapa natans]
MEAREERETYAEVVKEEEEEEEVENDDNGSNIGDSIASTDDEDALKRRISTHPLYGKLVKMHLDCLKVGVIGDVVGDRDHHETRCQPQMDSNKSPQRMLHQSDLDHFMEAYCAALSKLREAMEEPQQTTMAFISSMHSELQEMSAVPIAHSNAPALPHPPPTSSSGN